MGDFNKIDNGVIELPSSGGPIHLRQQVTNWVKARFEDWMEGHARKRVFQQRKEGLLDDDEYEESLRMTTEEVGAGTFRWGGRAWEKSIKSIPGFIKLLSLVGESAARKAGKKNDATEERLLELVQNADDRLQLQQVFHEVMQATPNFLAPPTKGAED